ncbi:MAG: ATP-binding protein, partial [Alphaproteobacteria bacterium]
DTVRTAVNESVVVAEAYLREHKQVIAADALAMANDLNRQWPNLISGPAVANRIVGTQAALRALSEGIVFDSNGQVIGRTGLSFALEMARPPVWALEEAAKGEVVILTSDSDDRVRALVSLQTVPTAFLYVGRFVDPTVLQHIERSQAAAREFQLSEVRRDGLQLTLTSIFVLAALLLLLAAVAAGLIFANRLARPIGRLVQAAERVRGGDLSVRVAEHEHEDEFATLTRAFNRMTRQLAEQRRELVEANRQLDKRRRFTETVLSGVSAGVIGLDSAGRVNLPNRSATGLLDLDFELLSGHLLDEVVPEMAPLISRVRLWPDRMVEDQVVISRDGRPRTLLVRIASERGGDGSIVGYVVTFDDVTELMSAQRKAAWADVARRIAHEIKNPLTPIQLAAERLKRKYLKEITSDKVTFEQCTDTIVRQVGDIGRMVDEFSSFARMPYPVMREEDLRGICREAVFLQRNAHQDIKFEIAVPDERVLCHCDRRLISQALTNLLQNAVDAVEGREVLPDVVLPGGKIRLELLDEGEILRIVVGDNGRGLPDMAREKLTEPYVTTRARGTGLGLAIVKKIMEDHDGELVLESNEPVGARVTMTLPEETLEEREKAVEAAIKA